MSAMSTKSSSKLVCYDELQFSSDSDGGISSGYDSGDIGDSESDREHTLTIGQATQSDTDYSDEELGRSDDYFSDSDSDIDEDDETVRYTDTTSLCDSLQYISSLPELCDVTFHVGSEKMPVYGVKAILGTRSRILYSMILKAEKDRQVTKKYTSKRFRRTRKNHGNQIIINIENYKAEVFRKIIQFIHCGAVDVDIRSVIGLLCGAEEFDLRDLKALCWDYLERLAVSGLEIAQLKNTIRAYCDHDQWSRIVAFCQNKKEKASRIQTLQTKRETVV